MSLLLSVIGLTALQIILGIDNVIFLSIVTSNLNEQERTKARRIGIVISMMLNTILILCAGFLSNMTGEILSVLGKPFNVHDIIMILGGFFLVYKAVKELYKNIEKKENNHQKNPISIGKTILTMAAIDLIFSIDSTITAIGMSNVRWVQLSSTLTAIFFMFLFFVPLNKFIEKHPSFKILALAFLTMIGFSLFVDGMGIKIPKGYVYSMMIFAIIMESLNIRSDKNSNIPKIETVDDNESPYEEEIISKDIGFDELGDKHFGVLLTLNESGYVIAQVFGRTIDECSNNADFIINSVNNNIPNRTNTEIEILEIFDSWLEANEHYYKHSKEEAITQFKKCILKDPLIIGDDNLTVGSQQYALDFWAKNRSNQKITIEALQKIYEAGFEKCYELLENERLNLN